MRAIRKYTKHLTERLIGPSQGTPPVVLPPEPAAVLAEGAAPFVPEPVAASTLAQPALTSPLAAPVPH